MRVVYWLVGISAILLAADKVCAQSPAEIYQRRVVPLLQSSKGSSCSECHLQGLNLSDFLTADPKASFAALRARGWIDTKHPDKSKLLEFIAKKAPNSTKLVEQVRAAELEAIDQWIRASIEDPESLNTPLPNLNDLKLDEALVRHARKDHVLARFVEVVWSQFERCANCHSPDRNAKQVEKNGEQMSWIVPNSPGETLQLLEDRKLILLDDPLASPLRTKALGRDEHGGGIKFPDDGQTDREWSKFLTDYAAIKAGRYVNSKELPKYETIRTWRTGLHLRIKELTSMSPGQYAVVLLHRIDDKGVVNPKATAMGEGRVSKDGTGWSTTLVRLDGDESQKAPTSDEWDKTMPDGRYQIRWIVPHDSHLSIQEILESPDSLRMNLEALWPTGHGSAKSIAFSSFTKNGAAGGTGRASAQPVQGSKN